MSHLPLLRKDAHHAPRLQAPRRGPQICFCVVVLLVFGAVVAWAEMVLGSTLPVRNVTATPPPPEAVQRLRAAASVPGVLDGAQRATVEQDLLASVGWLLERSLAAR